MSGAHGLVVRDNRQSGACTCMNPRISASYDPDAAPLGRAGERVSGSGRSWEGLVVKFFGIFVPVLILSFFLDSAAQQAVRKLTTVTSLRIAQKVGQWGDFEGVAVFALGLWALSRRMRWVRVCAWVHVMVVAAVLSGASANMVRVVAGRTRPNSGLVEGWHGPEAAVGISRQVARFHAFPSAHTALVAGFLAPVLIRVGRRSRRGFGQWMLAGGAVVGIGMMAGARVWAGVHHLSDVTAAVGLGVFWGLLVVRVRFASRVRRYFRKMLGALTEGSPGT